MTSLHKPGNGPTNRLFPSKEHDLVWMVLIEECGNNLPFLDKLTYEWFPA
jgi:hypothetical protein